MCVINWHRICSDAVSESYVNDWLHLDIYDLLGRSVAVLIDLELETGSYRVVWDSKNIPSGVYFY